MRSTTPPEDGSARCRSPSTSSSDGDRMTPIEAVREPENTMSAENEITEIVSRYTRAADRRDGAAMAALFETDAVSEIYLHGPAGVDDREPLGKLTGAEQIE